MKVTAGDMHFAALNELVRTAPDAEITIENCVGQRYIGAGLAGKELRIEGVPGNALGAYLNGSRVTVYGNTQEATGDTMNDGVIFIHGSAGDATGYAMRGGQIYIKGNAGYRTGIHMKQYEDKIPVIVIGGSAGSFLGEYQAGGVIVVLGIGGDGTASVGNFCGTGMHGGKMFLRCKQPPKGLPAQVIAKEASAEELEEIKPYLHAFCGEFRENERQLFGSTYYILTPNTKNPYKQLYTQN